MAKLVLFKLLGGNFNNGFPVSLQIFTEKDKQLTLIADADGRLPPTVDLPVHYQNWQSSFRNKVSGRYLSRMTVGTTSDTQIIEEIEKAKQELNSSINQWFRAEGDFLPIWKQIWKTLNDSEEEIRVIFKTENYDLQRIPLFLWNEFFEQYHRAEMGLYLPVKSYKQINTSNKVKVLAVFGHEENNDTEIITTTKIDLDRDWDLLTKLLSDESNAELIRLKKPTLDQLGDQIEIQNPQILFFAGHSISQINEERGLIQLNENETITIEDLRFELIKAVKQGLQLAIFNSCDGIGIAQQLSKLGIANIIVMREPVPDEVAQKFLQRFLEAFAAGKPLGLAVRRARERINRFERKFPGATWLPMIWQNPAKSSLTWQQLGGLETKRQSNQATNKSEVKENTQMSWLETAVIKPDEHENNKPNTKISEQENPSSKQSTNQHSLGVVCPSCNHKNPEGSIQCENCYTPLPASTSCPNCGTSVQTDATFCGQCDFNFDLTASKLSETDIQQPSTSSPKSSVSNNNQTYKPPKSKQVSSKNNYQASKKSKSSENLIGGRYRIIDCLRTTAFCETYIAEDTHLPGNPPPRCLVKKLQPQSNEDFVLDTARRLFDNEAKVLYRLNDHQQIPRLLAHLEVDDEFYLVQEYIEGKDLSQTEIVPGKQWSESQVKDFLIEVLEILSFVHQNNVIHRDIKPSNLMRRNSDGKIFLIDFGAVKEITRMDLTENMGNILTVAIGTPGYMATEQQRGDPRFNSDIYALGVTAIQAITGFHPDQLPRDRDTGEIKWRDRAPNCSKQLATILDKMVRNDFLQRYKNVNQVLEDLNRKDVSNIDEKDITKTTEINENPKQDTNIWKSVTGLFTKIMKD